MQQTIVRQCKEKAWEREERLFVWKYKFRFKKDKTWKNLCPEFAYLIYFLLILTTQSLFM